MPQDVAVAEAGHNRPPSDAEILREGLDGKYADLLARRDELIEAAGRVPDAVTDDDLERKLSDFIGKQIRPCVKRAEALRVEIKEPYLSAGRTVDGFFKDVSDPLKKVVAELEKRLTVYQRAKAAEERRRRDEEEQRARAEALRAAREAEEKAAAARDDTELADAIAAEEAANQAAAVAAQAERDADAKAADLSRTRGDYGSVASLRTFWTFDGLDRGKLDLEALRPHLPEAALEQAVRSLIKAGGRELRGVRIFEDTKTVVS